MPSLHAMLILQLGELLHILRRSLVLGDAGIEEFLPLVALELALSTREIFVSYIYLVKLLDVMVVGSEEVGLVYAYLHIKHARLRRL
jgi:hypothetical protein